MQKTQFHRPTEWRTIKQENELQPCYRSMCIKCIHLSIQSKISPSCCSEQSVLDKCAQPSNSNITAPRSIVKPLINVMLLIIASANAHKQFLWFVLFSHSRWILSSSSSSSSFLSLYIDEEASNVRQALNCAEETALHRIIDVNMWNVFDPMNSLFFPSYPFARHQNYCARLQYLCCCCCCSVFVARGWNNHYTKHGKQGLNTSSVCVCSMFLWMWMELIQLQLMFHWNYSPFWSDLWLWWKIEQLFTHRGKETRESS